MNKLILTVGLCVSMSAHAWNTVDPDAIVVLAHDSDTGTETYQTFRELETSIKTSNPTLHIWCTLKGNFSAGVINDRDEISKEVMLEGLAEVAKPKIAHYQWLEVQRIVNEYTLKNTNGEWSLEATVENLAHSVIREFQHCIINGF